MVAFMTAICPKTHSLKKYSFVLLGHPRKASVVALTPTSYSSFLPPDKGCWAVFHMSLNTYAVVTSAIPYLHTSYFIMDNILNTSAMIHNSCAWPHLSHLSTLGGVNHLMTRINKALCINQTITCIIEYLQSMTNHRNPNMTVNA